MDNFFAIGNGFLVIGRAAMDDVPLLMFENKAEARRYAKTVNSEIVEDSTFAYLAKIDVPETLNVSIVEFLDGSVVGLESFEM